MVPSIVAVHGLYGPREKTWSSEKHSSWLKHLVVTEGWEARVIKYVYNAEDMARSLYTRKAISREALRLLQKLAELRRGQDPVSRTSYGCSFLNAAIFCGPRI